MSDQARPTSPPWAERGQEELPPTLRALRDLVAAGSRVNHVVSRRAGLSESELVTLEHLSREQIGPAEVARRLEVSTAAATGIVDRLVARGHVERRPHEVDRRRTELHITGSGREEIVGHLVPMFIALDRHDASFTDEEREVVERYLRGAAAAFERVLEAEGP
ncbi:DNA-binding MarR family transcriptional regulator [Nocardioides cavernae]|uniref:DNA-binding MarR family transcriptional regulator n=1 Tax=Nocardioides cavernae TaxID=1921566 RepID=A0A7Y9KR79_9ACTN|nr:MarR family transcriptional regulator [Nocardioides cavernae]NYE36299.1 DNA-binding MarR family transcriptional regulator [Nocardioides cavernae]